MSDVSERLAALPVGTKLTNVVLKDVCIYHVAANQVFKVTLENDGLPKGQVA